MDDHAIHTLKEEISRQVHNLVDFMTEGLPPEEDEEVRQRLHETFRFWRKEG